MDVRKKLWPFVSALALCLFAWAGYVAVWGGSAVTTATFKAPPGSMSDSQSESYEIHSLEPNAQKASRIGRAYPKGGGNIVVTLYPDVFEGDLSTVNFVLVNASLEILWKLTPKSARQKVEQSFQQFISDTQVNLENILSSENFQQNYQPRFYEIINDAAREAFDDPDTKRALSDAYSELLEIFGSEFLAEYFSILTDKSSRVLDAVIDNFTANILNFEKGRKMDFDPVREAFEKVMQTPLFQDATRRRLETFLSSDAAEKLSTTFGRQFIFNAYRDPRLFALLNSLLSDMAYSQDLRNFEIAATRSIREVVLEVLTQGNGSMSPIGATILKNAFLGGRDKIVLMLNDQQYQSLSQNDPQAFKPFIRL